MSKRRRLGSLRVEYECGALLCLDLMAARVTVAAIADGAHNRLGVSLDGYGAGPEQSLQDPLGKRGPELPGWFVGTKSFKAFPLVLDQHASGRRSPDALRRSIGMNT